MSLPSALRRLLRIEDLLGILWLALLSPVSGDLFLEGGLATVTLALAGVSWWLAVLLRDRAPEGGAPAGLHVLFGSIGVAAIVIDAACKQLDHRELQLPTALAFVALAVIVLVQEAGTARTWWPSLPSPLRRALGWPFVVVMTESFAHFSLGILPMPDHGYLGDDAASLGEHLFMIAFCLAVLVVLFVFLIAMPRRVFDPRAPSEPRDWALRFGAALLSTLAGAWIVGPLWERLTGQA